MKIIKAPLLRLSIAAATVSAAYLLLLIFPQPLFAYSVSADHLVLHSDRPFSRTAAEGVLHIAASKLAKSPLYSNNQNHHIFVCNSPWRRLLFFNTDYQAGGVSKYPFASSVFLREAHIEDNRLISSRGTAVGGDRTLDYFIAHEVTHQLTGHALGPFRSFQLPQYVREGYADYIGKGNSFDYAATRHAFLAREPETEYEKSGLYLRFHLLVAYLLDHHRWTVDKLLRTYPPQQTVEAAVRSELSSQR